MAPSAKMLDQRYKSAHCPAMTIVRSTSFLRTVLLLAAGLAMVLQAAIPAGFMPGIGKQAGSFITICSTFGEKTVFVADETGEHGSGGGESCAYAFTLPALDDVPFVIPAYVSAFVSYPAYVSQPSDVYHARIDLSRPPTGPPAIV